MIFLCIPLVVLFYMLGGQINKLFRPIGVPLSIFGIYFIAHNHSLWMGIPVLLYSGILTLGYGVNSKLMKWFKSEQLVRILLGLLISLPVLITILLTHNWISLFGIPLIVGCSCIRLGGWGKIGSFEILPVDIFRGLSLGIAISLALI